MQLKFSVFTKITLFFRTLCRGDVLVAGSSKTKSATKNLPNEICQQNHTMNSRIVGQVFVWIHPHFL
jgi:hypothetical protein